MNRITLLVLCHLLPSILGKIADLLEDEVKETKTKWDDVAIEALRVLSSFLPQLCEERKR